MNLRAIVRGGKRAISMIVSNVSRNVLFNIVVVNVILDHHIITYCYYFFAKQCNGVAISWRMFLARSGSQRAV